MVITPRHEITQGLKLYHYNDIPVLKLTHEVGEALIALQGAHLLQWRPSSQQESVLWLSDVEPFELGKAIRGGIPLCYPWFNQQGGTPAHGYARITLWKLADYCLKPQEVTLTFQLLDEAGEVEAEMQMRFSERCELRFTHFRDEAVQLAMHSYFQVSDIENLSLLNLPTLRYNFALAEEENLPEVQKVNDRIDAIYAVEEKSQAVIKDKARQIQLTQQNASDMVLWNPGEKGASGMKGGANRQMLCLETARIRKTLPKNESVVLTLSVQSL